MTSFGYRSNPHYAIKECPSCGTLYTRDCVYSIGTVKDKILVFKPPKNCARCTRCGYLVDGPHCQGCALLRQELKENLVIRPLDFQNTSEPSNASTNTRSGFDLNRAPDSPNQFHCFHCKDVLRDGEACKRCTCVKCGSGLGKGLCYICGHNQNSLNDSPSISETSSQSLPKNNHCCYECGDPLDDIFCKRCTFTPTEPIDSLSMGDEHLDTIPATESDEFINDDQSLSDEDVPEKIYSNHLFDEEIIPMEINQHSFNVESDLIESMPNHDSSIIISLKIDSLFDEFAGEPTLLKSFPPGIDETDCHPEKKIRFAKRLLYNNSSPRPPEEIISDNSHADIEFFSPFPIPNKDSDSNMEEIDLSFNSDDPMPPGIEEDDYDSERDIPILEELLDSYSLSLPATESYHFDIPSPYRPPAKPPDGNTETLNIKMMDDVSDQKVPIPNLTITRVLNQEKSPDLLSHQGFEAFQPSVECPMIINGKNVPLLDVPLFHLYPP
uniref:Pre-mRNA splicing Prp18-interacting factor n=1 Tax=Tanacetum cinerariifolium TaxID=118510 RepID=A0A6L2NNL2_TANCI|nr:hypothetical protein [Tanacetum cinerariifolium]